MHRFIPIAVLGALVGCQAILGLDDGQKRPEGQGGDNTSANSSAAVTSASTGGATSTGTGGAPTTASSSGGTNAASTGSIVTGSGGTTASSSSSAGSGGSGGTNAASTGSSVTGSGGTTASSSSSAGSGGSGGSLGLDLIDDMEDANGLILPISGRAGSWFTYNDSTGTQSPVAGAPVIPQMLPQPNPGVPMSMHAMHTTGSAFTIWGAGIGFDLNHIAVKQVYDVTGYTGITFWGLGNSSVRLRVPIKDTVATLDGGSCLMSCGDHHGKPIPLTASWQQHFVPFSELTQEGWGAGVAFDHTTVFSIQFSVVPNVDFDFWLDDISFYK